MSESEAASFKGLPDRRQQYFVILWFRQEFDSPSLHGLDRLGHVAIARYEDNRHVAAFSGHTFLQVQAIEARKRNIKEETAWNQGSWMLEEFLRGRKRFRPPAFAADQEFQRLAYRNIVVYDKYN